MTTQDMREAMAWGRAFFVMVVWCEQQRAGTHADYVSSGAPEFI